MIFTSIRKRLKTFTILSSLTFLIPSPTSTFACGYWPEEEELRYMVFNPDLLNNKSWWTFFYNNRYLYLDGSVLGSADEDLLIQEWKQKLNSKATLDEIKRCVYGSLPDDSLKENTFFEEIQKNTKLREYFSLAKKAEALSAILEPLEEDGLPDKESINERTELIFEIKKTLTSERDPFLARRYAFQLLKLSYYAGDTTTFNTTYNRYFKGQESHVLDWWALHYKSMTLEQEPTMDSANYLHARVFSHSSNKKNVSKEFFSREKLADILALARNDEERGDILVLSEVVNPGRSLDGIRQINQLFPTHKELPMLVMREINKLEDWLGSRYVNLPYESEVDVENREQDLAYLKEFLAEYNAMEEFASGNAVFYALTMAYLNLMNNNPDSALGYLEKVNTKNPDVRYQYNVLKLIQVAQKKDISNSVVQEEIGKMLGELVEEREGKFESQKILFSLTSYLRYEFANRGMIHFAGLLDNLASNKFCYTCNMYTFEYSMIEYLDENADETDVEKVVALYNKRDKNSLEKILFKPYFHPYYFYDLLAVKYLRNDKPEKAREALSNVPDEFWDRFRNAAANTLGDPFAINRELLDKETIRYYNKREVVDRIIALTAEMENYPASRAKNNFLLGNAWFNFADRSWFMLSYQWTLSDTYPTAIGEMARIRAKRYYKQALQFEQEPEAKAKILYMLALLSEADERYRYGLEYQKMSHTKFHERRNCLTLAELTARF
jgi:hypothetical protein